MYTQTFKEIKGELKEIRKEVKNNSVDIGVIKGKLEK